MFKIIVKHWKLLSLGLISTLLIAVSVFVFFVPKNYDFVIFGGRGFRREENLDNDLYDITLVNLYDPEPNWYPGEEFGTADQPNILGEGAVLVDMDSGKILYEKDAVKRMKIASLTKIMTAVVVLEHTSLQDTVHISSNADSVGENTMAISEGEIYTVEELLYGLILHSGNDAAYALAEHTAKDSKTFVDWMNKKAFELGLKDSYFADPSGLDDSTYSTAVDMIRLTRYALKNPDFKRIVGTLEIDLSSDTHKYLSLYNQTNLLNTYPGVKGVKTGFTDEAGLCLVTYAENGGKSVIGIVLSSGDRKGDMILMLDHGFSTLGVNIDHEF
jgi:D-alanyl-D-alanine carboxypeptidase (penicillin-binding protein 5/6)